MLIICEKPSVAKDFATALGANGKKGYYQGDGTVITYCVGHLYELAHPEDYDPKYRKWLLDDLPIIPKAFRYIVNASTQEQAEIVVKLLRQHIEDEVLIATDAGREGELIARIALHEAGINDIKRFRRFWVSEALSPQVIRLGIQNAKPLSEYNTLSAQAFARQKADWITGMNLSRFMSIGSPPPPFSVGRVQTAVLSAIASRNEEVKNFVREPFKELAASIMSKDGVLINALLENPKTGKTSFYSKDEDYLLAAADNCKDKLIDSINVVSREKRQKPEKLLNITGLQKAAFRRFGFKPEETLAFAQSLYETHKCLSYPRTPSRVMGDNNIDLFREKFELLKSDSPLSRFCSPSLISVDNKHIFDSAKLEDHHALIPLARIPDTVNENERKVYSIVLQSFFSVCMPDYIYNEKSLRFNVFSYGFTSRIRETLQKGWKAAALNIDEEAETDEPESPFFDTTACIISSLKIKEKLTEPKKEFALDTLLAFMEHPMGENGTNLAGLGTPATRAEIIKTLFIREYIKDEKRKLYVTSRGSFLLEQLNKNKHLKKMADVEQTTEWENRLALNPEAFEKEITQYVTQCVMSGLDTRATFRQEPLGPCPICGKPVIETKMGYSCSGYKDEGKCSFIVWKTIATASVSLNDISLLLIGQKTKPKKCKNKDGKPFEASFVLENGKIAFLFK